MPVEYINFKGDKYYLHEGLTKKGNPKYWFSKNLEGKLVDEIPDGFEIYEEPNGMVFLRRIGPKLVTDEEIKAVEDSIPEELRAKVDVKKDVITIYLAEFFYVIYMAMMRFILIDKTTREFEVERYCFRGSIDDWIGLDRSTDLKQLAKKYCFHLGKESFYDLSYFI